jgi:hypothetical protein
VVAIALAVAGATCIAVAVSDQDRAVDVPLAVPAAAASRVPSPAPVTQVAVAPPTTITIPAIRVRSALLQLGQAADGSLAPPPPGPHYDEAGWYRFSPRPGAIGPSVIVGHIDSKSGGPSVFFRLGELRRGDTIDIRRTDGTSAVFAVEAVRRFHKTAFPTQLVYGNTDGPALRLISCGGPFDRATGHYLDNVVVTASMVRTA